MTRVVAARVTDDQWDWLADRAIEIHDGDLSQAHGFANRFLRESRPRHDRTATAGWALAPRHD